MKRLIDIVLSAFGLAVTLPLLIIIFFAGIFDTGSPVFTQIRVGRHQKAFTLIKFRTMQLETKSVASHLADAGSITKLGLFLRRTKLDELPQLWNVLTGDMSLVGPRPGLYSQTELIIERAKLNVYSVRPGITGLAQVSNIDMSTPVLLAQIDAKMIASMSIFSYLGLIVKTMSGHGTGDSVIRR